MNIVKRANSYTYTPCLYSQSSCFARTGSNGVHSRGFARSTDSPQEITKNDKSKGISEANEQSQAEGRMSERLEQMTDAMIEQDGRRAKKAIDEGGFSEELKKKLEARLQESSFRSENAAAFAQASLPVRSNHPLVDVQD